MKTINRSIANSFHLQYHAFNYHIRRKLAVNLMNIKPYSQY